jgi:hypothetical protein
MRYDIHSWEELEELADNLTEENCIVLHVGGCEIMTRVESNQEVVEKTLSSTF